MNTTQRIKVLNAILKSQEAKKADLIGLIVVLSVLFTFLLVVISFVP